MNLFINNLNEKDVDHFTTDIGLKLRKSFNTPFKKACNSFTNANIIKIDQDYSLDNFEYFKNLDYEKIPITSYPLVENKNNIILERYPRLKKNVPYIFVCNHTCPEDIETVLNIIDRNAYLVLGSIESLKYNPEMYLLWLNGMIPFDILNDKERNDLIPKMVRVLKTNSILIFPEGSHNYDYKNIINPLYDGAINTALQTGREIVVLTLVRDKENNISYIDASNPINVSSLAIDIQTYYPFAPNSEKYYIKSLSSYIRDLMATAEYYITIRHFDKLCRKDYENIAKYFRDKYIKEAFSGLKWKHDVFDAEYLVKKDKDEREYEDIVKNLTNLRLPKNILKEGLLNSRDWAFWIQREKDLIDNDVPSFMRNYWLKQQDDKLQRKRFLKRH